MKSRKSDMPFIDIMVQGDPIQRIFGRLRMRRAVWQAEMRRRKNSRILNVPVPKAISLSVTTHCPKACEFCGAPQTESRSDLQEALARRIVAEAEELGIFIVILVGGEPLLREDLVFSLVRTHRKMFFLLFIGMDIISPETARKASARNLLTLVATGGDKSHGSAVRQELRRAGAAFGFSAVVSDCCSDELSSSELITSMAKEGCRMGLFLERLPVGRASGLGYGLSKASRIVFRESLRCRERETGLPLTFFPEDEEILGGCAAAGRTILHINADGGVEPCPFIHETIEDLNAQTLSKILKSPLLSSVRHVACSRSLDYPCALLKPQGIGNPEV